MRLEGCDPGPENNTVVFCHLNGGGMGLKQKDLFGFYGCHICHSIYDQRIPSGYARGELECLALQAMKRTQEHLLEQKLVRI